VVPIAHPRRAGKPGRGKIGVSHPRKGRGLPSARKSSSSPRGVARCGAKVTSSAPPTTYRRRAAPAGIQRRHVAADRCNRWSPCRTSRIAPADSLSRAPARSRKCLPPSRGRCRGTYEIIRRAALLFEPDGRMRMGGQIGRAQEAALGMGWLLPDPQRPEWLVLSNAGRAARACHKPARSKADSIPPIDGRRIAARAVL